MAAKRYKSLTGTRYTFPVSVGGKAVWVSFGGPQNTYVAPDEELQKAIESSRWFKNKQIGIDGIMKPGEAPTPVAPKKPAVVKPLAQTPAAPPAPEQPKVPTGDEVPTGTGGDTETPGGSDTDGEKIDEAPKDIEYPDVVDINGAKDVLKAEPYKVHHLALTTPERIRAQATIHGVVFPNWK